MTQRGNAEPKALTPKQTFASGEKKGEMGKNHKRWGRIIRDGEESRKERDLGLFRHEKYAEEHIF